MRGRSGGRNGSRPGCFDRKRPGRLLWLVGTGLGSPSRTAGSKSEVVVESDRGTDVQPQREVTVRGLGVAVDLDGTGLIAQTAGIEHDADVFRRAEFEVEQVEAHLEHRGVVFRDFRGTGLRLVLAEADAHVEARYVEELLAQHDVVAHHRADDEQTALVEELFIGDGASVRALREAVADGAADRQPVDDEVVELRQDFEAPRALFGGGGRGGGRLRAGRIPGQRSRNEHAALLLGAQSGGHAGQCDAK